MCDDNEVNWESIYDKLQKMKELKNELEILIDEVEDMLFITQDEEELETFDCDCLGCVDE